jgi:hypothetical protein
VFLFTFWSEHKVDIQYTPTKNTVAASDAPVLSILNWDESANPPHFILARHGTGPSGTWHFI